MSGKELDRVGIISRVSKREMCQKTAAERLEISVRQVWWKGIVKMALRVSYQKSVGNRVLPPELKREALDWIQAQYWRSGLPPPFDPQHTTSSATKKRKVKTSIAPRCADVTIS